MQCENEEQHSRKSRRLRVQNIKIEYAINSNPTFVGLSSAHTLSQEELLPLAMYENGLAMDAKEVQYTA